MKNLNNKGYLTIEIILASVIAFTIAFFLIEITINFSNASDNYYIDTLFITDKSLVTSNIKKSIQNDINDKGKITSANCTNSACTITYNNGDEKEIIYNEDKEIEYGGYKKKIKTVNFNSMSVSGSFNEGDYLRFVISFDNPFTNNNYDINILIYNGNTEKHELLVDHIEDLYNLSPKTIAKNSSSYCTKEDGEYSVQRDSSSNSQPKAMLLAGKRMCDIEYNYAPSVGLMKDRYGGASADLDSGNIRYYGREKIYYREDDGKSDGHEEVGNWSILEKKYHEPAPFNTTEGCLEWISNKGGWNDYIEKNTGYATAEEFCSVETRYYKTIRNYIDIGDKYEKDFTIGNWLLAFSDKYKGSQITNSEQCKEFFDSSFSCDTKYNELGFYSSETCQNYFDSPLMQKYNSVDKLCSTTTIPAGTSILYRIIGVFDGRVRVKRDTGIGFYSFDTSPNDVNNGAGINEWSQSDLLKLLNPEYSTNSDQICNSCEYNYDTDEYECDCSDNENVNNSLWFNSQKGKCYNERDNKVTECDFTSIGLSNFVKDKIVNQKINLGFADYNLYPENSYLFERDNSYLSNSHDGIERKSSWTGKVGLVYPSDLGYAVDFNYCNNSALSNYHSCTSGYDCSDYNWLSEGTSWAISPSNRGETIIQGRVTALLPAKPINSWPVLMLDPSLSLSGGNGSKTDPYVLEGVTFVPGEINLFEQAYITHDRDC